MSTIVSPAPAPNRNPRPSLPLEPATRGTNGHRGTPPRHVMASALADLLFVAASGLAAYRLRFSSHLLAMTQGFPGSFLEASHGVVARYLGFLLIYGALLVLVAYSQKLYDFEPNRSPVMDSLLVARAVTVATVLLTAFIYLSGIKTVSRLVVAIAAGFSFLSLSGWRLWRWQLARRRLVKGIGLRHAIIIGAGKVGILLADYLKANAALGYEVRGFLDSNHHGDPRILGTLDDLARVARQQFADEVFITIPSERELVKRLALEAMTLNLDVKVVPELYDGLAWQCPLDFVGEVPVRVLHREPIPALGLFLKRMTDIAGSAFGLILLSPLLALIALIVKIDSPGPVLYRGYRMGKKGRKFLCYKFRTMIRDAEAIKGKLKHLNERDGPFFKISNDPRVTRVGRFLRKYSLDELPQLWNVLTGEMSLVGPRPHPMDEVENYTLEHFRRLDVTPGITCLWQTEAREDPSFEKALALDSKYIENWSYFLDLRILLRTIPVLLKGTGH
jgi:exopolysaccharide biosynthesis polyprenyl glycosylphosphotransferase